MVHAAKRTRPARSSARPRASVPPRVPYRGDLGFGALIVTPEPPPRPATSATWVEAMRRFARGLVWTLPAYAAVYGLATLGRLGEGNHAPYLSGQRPLQLAGWLGSFWLGLMALVAVGALLAGTRSGRAAGAGLMLAVAGVAVMLPFATLSGHIGAIPAHALLLAGASIYSLGWLTTGWAVLRCRMLALGDGVVLMLAAPMLGVAGLLIGPLQTAGALLAFAAGLGIAWRSGRLLPMPVPHTAS